MAAAVQGNSGEQGNVTCGNSAATYNALESNLTHPGGSASPGTRNKGKKRRRASSGGIQGNLPNARGPKVAGVVLKAKGKHVQIAGSWDVNPSPQEEESDKSSQEGRGQEAEPGKSTRAPAQPLLIAYAAH
jgi:hypothetical protein